MGARKLDDLEQTTTQRSHVDQRNGVIIPMKMRKKLGLASGDPVSISLEEGAIVIRKVEQSELMAKRKNLMSFIDKLEPAANWSVDDFLNEKKQRGY